MESPASRMSASGKPAKMDTDSTRGRRSIASARSYSRRRGGGQRWHQGDGAGIGAVDHAAQAGAGPAVGLQQLAAVTEVVGLELRAVGANRTEGVRLVREHRHEEAHRAS